MSQEHSNRLAFVQAAAAEEARQRQADLDRIQQAEERERRREALLDAARPVLHPHVAFYASPPGSPVNDLAPTRACSPACDDRPKEWASRLAHLAEVWRECPAEDGLAEMLAEARAETDLGECALMALREAVAGNRRAVEDVADSLCRTGTLVRAVVEGLFPLFRRLRQEWDGIPVADEGDEADTQDQGVEDKSRRPCYERDHTWLKWRLDGMTPAKIRDRWNSENPGKKISKGSPGRDTVKKGLRAAEKDEGGKS